MEQTGNTSPNGHRSGNGAMSFTDGAVRTVSGIAEVTTSSIGALGGAAVGSVVGGVRGAVGGVADGVRKGLDAGGHSTPAAILTMAAVGAAGLVEWPVVLTVGGAALVLRRLHERGAPRKAAMATAPASEPATRKPAPQKTATTPKKTTARQSTARQSTARQSTPRTAASRQTAPRKTKPTKTKSTTPRTTTPRTRGRTAQ